MMHNKRFAIGLTAIVLAGAFGLAASSPAGAMSSKQCGQDWKDAKAAGTTAGMTYRDFQQSHCKGAAEPAAAATPAPAAAATPKPKKTEAAAPAAPVAATGAGQFAAEAEAKAHCPSDTVVWLNTKSHKYHFSGHKSYGTTKKGAYMCEADAKAAGNVAAKGEQPK
jgi:hypothetical protein